MYTKDNNTINEVYDKVALLFGNHGDLWEEFTQIFFPNYYNRLLQEPSLPSFRLERNLICITSPDGSIEFGLKKPVS
jgi:hypothetical protein